MFRRPSLTPARGSAGSAALAEGGGAAARYEALKAIRRPYLDRAREAAALSAPFLMPPEGQGAAPTETPFQGLGARGVANLSSKFLLALFPPGAPFFRLNVDDAARAGREAEIDAVVAALERRLTREMETGFFRVALHAALKQLIVAGNVLIHVLPSGGLKLFRLDRYVVRRDPMGNLLEIIAREDLAPETLPPRLREALPPEAAGRLGPRAEGGGAAKSIALYTHIQRDENGWSVVQELGGAVVPGTRGRYPPGKLDWLALRWSHAGDEDYGRGHVEEYLGDLRSLEGLMRAIVEGAAISSKVTVLVSPSGQTDAEELAEAENGAIIDGAPGDVGVVSAGKMQDFRVAFETAERLTERLGFAFLLNSAARRDATGVTAEEIRFVASELEDGLGGVYSVLSQELQLPLVEALMHHQAQRGASLRLPPGVVKPMIVTGLDALGRGRELGRLQALMSFAAQVAPLAAGPVGAHLDATELMRRAAAAIGVNADGLLRGAPASHLHPPLPGGVPSSEDAVNALAGAPLDALLTPERLSALRAALVGASEPVGP